MATIFHISYRGDWEDALRRGSYTQSTRGRTLAEQGFIHGSGTPDQVESVANAFYAGEHDLVVLVIEESRLHSAVRYELVPGSDVPFPHIYGPLNPDAVVEVLPLEPDASGRFHFAIS